MAPLTTSKVQMSLSHSRLPPNDEIINQLVAKKLKVLLRANKIRLVNPASKIFRPRCDLFDNPPANLVTAMFELPGVKRSEVALNLREGVLVVAGERFRPEKYMSLSSFPRFPPVSTKAEASAGNELELKSRYVLEELRYGTFERRIQLPEGTQDADINAHMSDGMLIVTWPRQPSCQKSSISAQDLPTLPRNESIL
ncbi:HSP20-like chaperone [Lentinula detonsa]|uniref:HSP20-like chaperone n=1 Tax=Lentinula detonsa TaxID=2804962 RepID=A0AA38PTY2_9AGAR|nr:HSP20-like chaperone [Lentinula detonsa]